MKEVKIMIINRTLDIKIESVENGVVVDAVGRLDFKKEVLTNEELNVFGGGNRINPVLYNKTYVFENLDDSGSSLAEISKNSHKDMDALEAQVLKASGGIKTTVVKTAKNGRGRPKKSAN